MLCFLEEITKWVDDGSPVDVLYLDFQKAFDKVPHQILISKLKSHGMENSLINWIEQWLTYRRQRVVVEGEVSSWKSVLSRAPQGSVLGPILFLVYSGTSLLKSPTGLGKSDLNGEVTLLQGVICTVEYNLGLSQGDCNWEVFSLVR